jgi:Raf kinase inhibitor-like YbhB/YbcL family protein
MDIKVTSTAFADGGMIPPKYTADGQNVTPPLEWTAIPPTTQSFALIADDPDAPVGTWVHWVLYNIPADVSALQERIPPDTKLDNGALHGLNDFGRYGYGGPSPPSGTHRYYFKIYALDSMLDVDPGKSKDELLRAMKGHILAQGELMGRYRRQ